MNIKKEMIDKLNFLDLFAGIGGFRLGMEMAGHKCVGYVEWDKFARRSYQAMYNTKGEWTRHDITTVTDDDIREFGRKRRVDVICGGFPCQAFSIAGKRKGFQDTRGTLFFDIARFANILRPRYLFLENVKGLLNHDNGNTFETILRTLDELGYDVEWDLLNSKDFGVPQNRERVFIIGHLRGSSTRKVLPVGGQNGNVIKQLGNIDQHKRDRDNPNTGRIYDVAGLSPTLSTMQGGGLEPKIIDRDRIRKLTPKECFRLQGFPDELFDKAQKVNSNSQLYKQAGNAVTVNVIYEIAKKL